MAKTIVTLAALLALALACVQVGCERPAPSAAPEAPATRQITLDETVRYVYRDFAKGRRHAERLEDVPLEQRGAVILHIDGEAADDETVYVADLLDASSADKVRAYKMSRRAHFQRARAAELGHWHAQMVDFAARERAQLDPRSQRSAASREAKTLIDEMIEPKTDQEVSR